MIGNDRNYELQMFYQQHTNKMIERFIWLRELDGLYARETLKAYVSDKNCPNPDLERLVRREWIKRQREKGQECTF
jgi:hypothetical protein